MKREPEALANAAQRIHDNPLGRLMHGQRELFHSNLIAWFFDVMPLEADAVFQPLTTAGAEPGRSVAREQGNLDLVMLWPNKAPLVIENKVFSVPGPEQLVRYRESVATWQNKPHMVLLSPGTPDFALDGWKHRDYTWLADSIERAVPSSADYNAQTMRRYAHLARDLDGLVKSVDVVHDDEPVWMPSDLLGPLASSQMRAALHKARGHALARRINRDASDGAGAARSAMTRSLPLVEVLRPTEVDGVRLRGGWQLQGRQFRRSVLFEDDAYLGRDDHARRARTDFARAHPGLFRFPASLPQLRGGRSEFNHFNPDSIYQYVNVPGLTAGQLVEAAREVDLALGVGGVPSRA